MGTRELERMKELEAQGASFSRNKRYEYWNRPENRGVLKLHRRMKALRAEIDRLHRAGQLAIELEEAEGGAHHLVMVSDELAMRRVTRLSSGELAYLADDPRVERAFAAHGIEAPSDDV